MKRSIVAVTLAVVFVMALAAPAFAMNHSVTYEMDGVIDYKRQAGHLCNTGASHKQTITGEGEMSKVSNIAMMEGRLTMEDVNDYVAGDTGLTVTSAIELCAPPKYTYDGAAVHPSALYNELDQPYTYYGETAGPELFGGAFGTTGERDADPNYDEFTALTNQVWAVQVAADPGYSGNLHQDFEAAYGPYWGYGAEPFADDDAWTGEEDTWRWETDDDGVLGAGVGEDYVGNYFNIDQHARTSMGEVKRYIDVSSPWSHAYLMEDMSVVGESDIEESFDMTNLAPGAEVPGLWWDLF